MTEQGDQDGLALWRRWRSRTPALARDGGDKALLLAAYLDGRLRGAKAEAVEDWLVDHPEALDDMIAARALQRAPLPEAPEAMIARAQALIARPNGSVVPLAPAAQRGWRSAAAWSGVAAGLLATSLIGFTLGSSAYLDVMAPRSTVESTFHQLL